MLVQDQRLLVTTKKKVLSFYIAFCVPFQLLLNIECTAYKRGFVMSGMRQEIINLPVQNRHFICKLSKNFEKSNGVVVFDIGPES